MHTTSIPNMYFNILSSSIDLPNGIFMSLCYQCRRFLWTFNFPCPLRLLCPFQYSHDSSNSWNVQTLNVGFVLFSCSPNTLYRSAQLWLLSLRHGQWPNKTFHFQNIIQSGILKIVHAIIVLTLQPILILSQSHHHLAVFLIAMRVDGNW
jgi:hypothetical protein